MSLRARIEAARVATAPEPAERARRGLVAFVEAMQGQGKPQADIVDALASGKGAQAIGRLGLQGVQPQGFACAQGCAFCCILRGQDGGTMTKTEALELHAALAPLAGQPDGRDWHPQACPSLDPETRLCRAYDARPMICRTYVSTDVDACKKVADGEAAPGPGTLGPYHSYLAALGLSRAALKGKARVASYALARVAAAAVAGLDAQSTLAEARHKPAELEAELRRSKRDLGRARPPG